MSACGSGRGGGHRGDGGRGRGLCRVTVTVPVGTISASSTSRTVLSISVASHRSRYSGFPPPYISLPFACTRPSPLTRLNLLPTCLPPRALPLQVRRSPVDPSPHRPSLPSTLPLRSPHRHVRLPIIPGPRTEPWSPAVAISPPFRVMRLLAHLLRFVVPDPYRVLYLHLFLCVAVRSPAPYPECPF